MTYSPRPVAGLLAVVGLTLSMTAVTAEAASADSPPGVVTGPASEVSDTAATLAGDVDPGGLPADSFFEYGTTAAYGLVTAVDGTWQ